jgi:hypothetical protein
MIYIVIAGLTQESAEAPDAVEKMAAVIKVMAANHCVGLSPDSVCGE